MNLKIKKIYFPGNDDAERPGWDGFLGENSFLGGDGCVTITARVGDTKEYKYKEVGTYDQKVNTIIIIPICSDGELAIW